MVRLPIDGSDPSRPNPMEANDAAGSLPNVEQVCRADFSQTGGHFAVHEVKVPPGVATPLHAHAAAEVFVVLAGRFEFELHRETQVETVSIATGAVITVPPDTARRLCNVGREPGRLLLICSPLLVTFFRDETPLIETGSDTDCTLPTQEEIQQILCQVHKSGQIDCRPPVD